MSHFLITGHTGFKGSWLTLLLKARGHEISGLALDPAEESLFFQAGLSQELVHDLRVDIRDRETTLEAVRMVSPDFVIHMAAQALVREGYRRPVETYDTNVSGTINVLLAVDAADSVQAQLIVTTDKVYEDRGYGRPYVETDPLGGKDPYSASKAMADLVAQEWLARPHSKPGVIARAGNVIGAGDYSIGRLIPDILRASLQGSELQVRYPEAVRPWQHVLDCVNGYLALLTDVVDRGTRGCWNVGPSGGDARSVAEVIELAIKVLGPGAPLVAHGKADFAEDGYLELSSSAILRQCSWRNLLDFETSVRWALELPKPGQSLGDVVRNQVATFDTMPNSSKSA